MMVSTYPTRALERLQREFADLIDSGINPTVVLHHSREDRWLANGNTVPNDAHVSPFDPAPDRWMKYRSAVNGRPYYCRDWAYELRPNGYDWDGPRLYGQYSSSAMQSKWFTTSLGWFVATSADQLGNHRYWHTYAAPEAVDALDKATEQAGQIIRNAIGTPVYDRIFSAFRHVPGYVSQGDVLPNLPTHYGTGCLAGIWRDTVSHFALRRLPQAPIGFRVAIRDGMDTASSPELPLRRELNPSDWIGPNQPAYSVVTIPDFCRASITVIDALLDGWDAAEAMEKDDADLPGDKAITGKPIPPAAPYLDVAVDPLAFSLSRDGQTADLTGQQFKLSGILLDAGAAGLSTDEFDRKVRACGFEPDAKATAVSGLKQKLAKIGLTIPDVRSGDKRYRIVLAVPKRTSVKA